MNQTAADKPRVRTITRLPWFQFSLRSLLILMMLVASFCAGWTANPWREQQLRRAKRDSGVFCRVTCRSRESNLAAEAAKF